MKVLLAAVGSRGDVQPMLALALALRARGHAVRFCAPPNFERWIDQHGFPFHALGLDTHALLSQIGPAVHRGAILLRRDIRDQFRALEDLVGDADAIVGASIHCAGLSFAEKLGLPYAYVCYTPGMLPSSFHPSPTCRFLHLPRWLNRATWWLNDRAWNLLFRRSLNHERRRLGLPPVPSAFRHVLSGHLILASEPGLGGPPADTTFPAIQTGTWFLPPTAAEPLDPALDRFITAGPPPIYVGFGSMADLDATRTTALVIEAARRAGLRLVIGRGWSTLGEEASDHPHVQVVGSVAHASLFPRMCAVVHHGGAGTTAAAARAGVPQVLVPHFLDQFSWAERVAALELGPRGPRKARLSVAALAAAMRACVDQPRFAERARAFAGEMILDGVDRGVRAIEALSRHRDAALSAAG